MATGSKEVRDTDARREEESRSATMRPENMNEDGSVSDPAAQAFWDRQQEHASAAPNERKPVDDSVGTPAWVEENSPENMHSDGGSTLHYESQPTLEDLAARGEVRDETGVAKDEEPAQRKEEDNANKPVAAKKTASKDDDKK